HYRITRIWIVDCLITFSPKFPVNQTLTRSNAVFNQVGDIKIARQVSRFNCAGVIGKYLVLFESGRCSAFGFAKENASIRENVLVPLRDIMILVISVDAVRTLVIDLLVQQELCPTGQRLECIPVGLSVSD